MNYRRLGNSGLMVSEIALGSWISFNNVEDIDSSAKIIGKAYENGINFFDTSNAYQGGNAEVILGRALSRYPRETYVIATKVFFPTGDGPNDHGLSRKHIFEQVKKSLKRLDMEYIDLYYCHWYDANTPVEETLMAMDDLVKSGLVLYYGVSNWTAAQIAYGLKTIERYGLHPFIANQPSYNMLDRYIEAETIPLCKKEGVGQVVYSPLAQGVLTGKYSRGLEYPKDSRALNKLAGGEVSVFDYLNDSVLETVEKLKAIAGQMGVSLAQLALAWVLREKNVTSAIIGASKPEQIEQNIGAVSLSLSQEAADTIEKVLRESKHRIKHNIIPW